jgi:hypothetical protein
MEAENILLLVIGVIALIGWTAFNLFDIRKPIRRQYKIVKCADGLGRNIWVVKRSLGSDGVWWVTEKEFSSLAMAQDHVRYLEDCDLRAKRTEIGEEPLPLPPEKVST